MGSKCRSINDAYVIDEPFGNFDTAGIERGDMVFDGDDRGGGEEGGLDGPGELGAAGQCPPAQISSPASRYLAADGDAFPNFDNSTIAMGHVSQSVGSDPLHRQPSAHSGEEIVNYPRPDESNGNPWFRGPPLAGSLGTPRQKGVEVSGPIRGPLGRAGRGIRTVNTTSMAGVVGRSCTRSDEERASTLARDPPGGATRSAASTREGATGRVASVVQAPDARSRIAPQRYYDEPTSPRPGWESPPLPVVVDGPRVPIYSAPRNTPRTRDFVPYRTMPQNEHFGDWPAASSLPPSRQVHTVVPNRPMAPSHRDCVDPHDQSIGLNPRIPMHIDSRTALRALNGEFIQLECFLDSSNVNEYEALDQSVDSMLRPLRPRKLITSLYKWMEAWGHYEVTLVSCYGLDMYYELASYRSFILSLTDKYKIPFILTYDERHRAALGRARSFDFSYFNNQLFVTIFDVGSLRATTKCTKCASVDHGTKDCPFRGGAPAGGVTIQGNTDKARAGRQGIDPNEICIRFQDGSCRFRKCPRRHCCLLCGGPNGAKSCGDCAGKAGTASAPKN